MASRGQECVCVWLELSLCACVRGCYGCTTGHFPLFHTCLPSPRRLQYRRGRKEQKKREWIKVILPVCSSSLPWSVLLLSSPLPLPRLPVKQLCSVVWPGSRDSTATISVQGLFSSPEAVCLLSCSLSLSLCFSAFHLSKQCFFLLFIFLLHTTQQMGLLCNEAD